MTLMGLTRGPNARFEGEAWFDGHELVKASDRTAAQRIRGAGIAMVFQDPMSSLDPVYRVGDQIVEQIRVHDHKASKAQALDRAVVADGAGRDPARGGAPALLPARVLGRDAPAGDDRDGALLLARSC